jgi:ribosomal protein S25
MNTTMVLLIVLVVLLVAVLVGLVILNSSIRRNLKELKEVASGLSVLAQVSDKNADIISVKIEKTIAELSQKINVFPKYDEDDLYSEVIDFLEDEAYISTSIIQKTFHVEYSTAAKVIANLRKNEVIERVENSNSNYACWGLVKDEVEEEEASN